MSEILSNVINAKISACDLACLPLEVRNYILRCIGTSLKECKQEIFEANAKDLKAIADTTNKPLLKRLELTEAKFDALEKGIEALINLEDPLNKTLLKMEITPGQILTRKSCPIGLLCIIYEARPEAGVQIAILALKSGNSLILKGGKEAKESNRVVFKAMRKGLEKAKEKYPEVPLDVLQLAEAREEINQLLALDQYIDLVIPRGSNSLVSYIQNHTKIPVLGHADGICHIYLDEDCTDIPMAIKVITESKTDYPAACNALECLLVHRRMIGSVISPLVSATEKFNVRFVVERDIADMIPAGRIEGTVLENGLDDPTIWHKEYLDTIMAIRVVDDMDAAIGHIERYSSHHTDCILTHNAAKAEKFMNKVSSASVYHNCSTRFADGFRYGFGAEVGISTSRVHARGPVGLDGLTTYKYVMPGNGQCIQDIGKTLEYTHKRLDIN